MIETATFNTILALAALMLIFAITDNTNRLYGNIVLMFLSAITFGWLGTAISVGAVSFTSAATGDILKMISFAAFLYDAFMIYEVIEEFIQRKAAIAEEANPV